MAGEESPRCFTNGMTDFDDATFSTALFNHRRIAVVGLSPRPERASHGVTRYMIEAGYEITGVRPGARSILERPVYSDLDQVPGPIEIVDVFRRAEAVPAIVDAAIRRQARVLWLQLGIEHPEAEARARAAGIIVVSNRCILIEHRRLQRTAG